MLQVNSVSHSYSPDVSPLDFFSLTNIVFIIDYRTAGCTPADDTACCEAQRTDCSHLPEINAAGC